MHHLVTGQPAAPLEDLEPPSRRWYLVTSGLASACALAAFGTAVPRGETHWQTHFPSPLIPCSSQDAGPFPAGYLLGLALLLRAADYAWTARHWPYASYQLQFHGHITTGWPSRGLSHALFLILAALAVEVRDLHLLLCLGTLSLVVWHLVWRHLHAPARWWQPWGPALISWAPAFSYALARGGTPAGAAAALVLALLELALLITETVLPRQPVTKEYILLVLDGLTHGSFTLLHILAYRV